MSRAALTPRAAGMVVAAAAAVLMGASLYANFSRLCSPASPDDGCGAPAADAAAALREWIAAQPGASEA